MSGAGSPGRTGGTDVKNWPCSPELCGPCQNAKGCASFTTILLSQPPKELKADHASATSRTTEQGLAAREDSGDRHVALRFSYPCSSCWSTFGSLHQTDVIAVSRMMSYICWALHLFLFISYTAFTRSGRELNCRLMGRITTVFRKQLSVWHEGTTSALTWSSSSCNSL